MPHDRQADDLALRTDHYELTMLRAALQSGVAGRTAVFEVFTRSLPLHRQFGVVAGHERLLTALPGFRFDADQVAWLVEVGVVDRVTAAWLADFRFSGSIDAYAEGELFFPASPVLTVTAPLGEALLLETLVLSVLNFDSAVASAAARMRLAAGDRRLIEMGSRRAHEDAAVAAARAAFVGGFDATSNLAAGRRFGIPTAGTAGHVFTLAHTAVATGRPADDAEVEALAFAAQLAALGPGTTLLVDTFDIGGGIRRAVEAARAAGLAGPAAIRIDSGDPAVEVPAARSLLDALGAHDTRIVISGDVDEHTIARLADVPVDAFGVGTSVVTGGGAPNCGFVYKLVAIAESDRLDAGMLPVAKRSAGKASAPNRKIAHRRLDDAGLACGEVLDDHLGGPAIGRPLQQNVVHHGEVVLARDCHAARAHRAAAVAELSALHRRLDADGPAFTATLSA